MESLHTLKTYAKDFKVDHNYTREKLRIFKNILPYLPKDYLDTSGRSIIATEKILKVLELGDYIKTDTALAIESHEMDTVERAYKIVTTLQEEINNSNIQKLGTVLDIMVNKDHYKQLVSLAMDLMSNENALKDPNNIARLLKSFLGEKEMENKNLNKIIDILLMLESGNEEEEEKEEQASED